MGWFGMGSWGAPICVPEDRIPVPIGHPCAWCEELIEEIDEGVTIRHLSAQPEHRPYHLDCHLRMIVGGANHQVGVCHCCGGTEPPDPPDLTKRQSAQVTVGMWRRKWKEAT